MTLTRESDLPPDAERWAQMFHDAYELAAPLFGYETREASRKPWADVPEANRALMTAVAGHVGAYIARQARAEQAVCHDADHITAMEGVEVVADLRAEVEAWKRAADHATAHWTESKAEVERLRALAPSWVAFAHGYAHQPDWHSESDWRDCESYPCNEARAALAATKVQPSHEGQTEVQPSGEGQTPFAPAPNSGQTPEPRP